MKTPEKCVKYAQSNKVTLNKLMLPEKEWYYYLSV